jgi:hypothetical protein
MYLPDKKPPGYGIAGAEFPEAVPPANEWIGAAAVGTSFLPRSLRGTFLLVSTEVQNYVTQQLFAFRSFRTVPARRSRPTHRSRAAT